MGIGVLGPLQRAGDSFGGTCPLPKLDRGTGRALRIERRWSAMSLVLALLGAARAALRTYTDLALENLALRQQLALLRHRSKRPRFGRLDRAFWMWLSKRWAGWRKALHVVRPETVIRWHRQGFRAFWTWKSRRGRIGRPPIGSEPAHLIRTMAHANPLWGAPRIHGELLKLGFEVCCFACSGLKGPRSAVAGQPSLLRGDAGSSCAQRQHEAR